MSDNAPSVAIFMFDVAHQRLSVDEINKLIQSHFGVVDWWNYIPGCYMLRLTCEPHELTDHLKSVNGYILASIDPLSLSGRLSKTAWEHLFDKLLLDKSDELKHVIVSRRGRLPFEKKS